ncbi:MAG: FAD:protein transferase [Baekduia sp.]|jgi:thiamine biosynthesis lipoprotein|nr:FAD:protein transferase [Baekduia sp.]
MLAGDPGAMFETTSHREFYCFGSRCTVHVTGDGPLGSAADAVDAGMRMLRTWDARFSRFVAGSELNLLNADPRGAVEASPLMRRLVRAIVTAAYETDGLVDSTLLDDLERAGYRGSFSGNGLTLEQALPLAPARRPARGNPSGAWAAVGVDERAGMVLRPPGVRMDSGGVGKGLFADELARALDGHAAFAVDCGGDLRLGGDRPARREVFVESPFEGPRPPLHCFLLTAGGVATSGIGRRSWLDADGAPAHHLLDPSTGRPAYTGLVQVTALAPTALRAEVLAKAALLAGPAELERRLPHGGLAVHDDGHVELVGSRLEAPPVRFSREAGRLVAAGTR